jgi:hypothetical protein
MLTRNQNEENRKNTSLLFNPEDGEDTFGRNVHLLSVISQKTELFISTAVKSSGLENVIYYRIKYLSLRSACLSEVQLKPQTYSQRSYTSNNTR